MHVATPQKGYDSFDAVSTLRYSQPANLSGKTDEVLPLADSISHVLQDGVKA
jgi:hypothetical protein